MVKFEIREAGEFLMKDSHNNSVSDKVKIKWNIQLIINIHNY